MPFERVFVCACDRIPQPDGVVLTSTGERPAVGTERYGSDPTCMPFESLLESACDRIPQPYSKAAPTGERPPVRTERYAVDII